MHQQQQRTNSQAAAATLSSSRLVNSIHSVALHEWMFLFKYSSWAIKLRLGFAREINKRRTDLLITTWAREEEEASLNLKKGQGVNFMESQWQSRRHCCRPMGMRGLEWCEFSMLPEICKITGIKTLSEQHKQIIPETTSTLLLCFCCCCWWVDDCFGACLSVAE